MTYIQAVLLGTDPATCANHRGPRAIAEQYRKLLANVQGLTLPAEPTWARSNWQSFCVGLPAHCDQRAAMQKMLDAGIATRRGIMCSHRERVYSDAPLKHTLKLSEAAQDHSIILPLYVQMQRSDLEHVAQQLAEAVSS